MKLILVGLPLKSLTTILVLVALLPVGCRRVRLTEFSVSPSTVTPVTEPLPERLRFIEETRIGGDEVTEPVFGLIMAVEWLNSGGVVVGDVQGRQILLFDAAGQLIRGLGSPGSGPGEFLSVAYIASTDSTITLYDDRQDKLLVFAADGSHLHSGPVGVGMIQGLESLPDGRLLALRAAFDGSPNLLVLTPTGEVVDSLGSGPFVPPEWPRDPFAPAGAICVSGRTAYLSNPLAPEIAAFDLVTGSAEWVKRYQNKLREIMENPADGPRRPRAIVMSLACDAEHIVSTYIDSHTRQLYYDVFSTDGNPEGRYTESGGGGQPYAGAVVGVRDGRILAYSNRPIPKVSTYQVQEDSSR
jgi:hypothetical protein